MTKLANYDKYDYDYKDYWDNRSYEDLAERNLINKALNYQKGERFIDIGGSYGRLVDTYKDRYAQCIIVDYSLKTLQKYSVGIKKFAPNCTLIAANAYNLPFKDNSFDGGMMVRVLHHIEDLEGYTSELHRVLSNNSLFLQEFANKVHIKAFIKSLLTLRFSQLDTRPYQQPSKGSNEGSKGEETVFLNYHPRHVRKIMEKNELIILGKKGCSFLRSDGLKKIMTTEQLMWFERIFQTILGWTNIPPSIFYTLRAFKDSNRSVVLGKIDDVIVCPKCKRSMRSIKHEYHCKSCNLRFKYKGGVWDLRI